MLQQLKTPFKKVYGKVRSRADGFVGPVKESTSKLLALFPNIKAFAGSEDLANANDADSVLVDGENAEGKAAKLGLRARFKNFKKSLKGLSDLQNLILLTIAVVLPAGILIAVGLASFLKKRKNKE